MEESDQNKKINRGQSDDFAEDTKNLYNEMMEIPRGIKRLVRKEGWGLIIPLSLLLGLIILIWAQL